MKFRFRISHFLTNTFKSILDVVNYKSKNKIYQSELRLKLKKETNRKRLDRVKIQRITDLHGKKGISIYCQQTANILATSK